MIYKCPVCQAVFYSLDDVYEHISSSHPSYNSDPNQTKEELLEFLADFAVDAAVVTSQPTSRQYVPPPSEEATYATEGTNESTCCGCGCWNSPESDEFHDLRTGESGAIGSSCSEPNDCGCECGDFSGCCGEAGTSGDYGNFLCDDCGSFWGWFGGCCDDD